ncbi:MAG: hypothetical protein CL677_07895 [Bdellovibrionaceae bacterium]|nr:hypothetical protein [Pseudobdellovibrionaceae bacterium]
MEVVFAYLAIAEDNDWMSRLPKRKVPQAHSAGFTLLEVMIVLVVVVAMSGFMITKLADPGRDARRFVNNFSLVTKQVQYQAKLYNTTYRLVIDLDINKLDGIGQRYWVERSAVSGIVLESEPVASADGQGDATVYEMDDRIFKEIKTFPEIVKVDEVELTRRKEPIREGRAYIYFLPQGMVDEAAIHLSYKEEKKWTLVTNPMSGQSDLVGKRITLKEVRSR